MIQQYETNNRFSDEIYGNRSGMSASEVAVNRRVVLENIKVLRHCGVLVEVDAAQCYDRIVHSLSSLVYQNEGSPISSLIMMYGAIQSMVYYLRTTFGDSTKSYDGKETIPFQGSCQGNGTSLTLWLIILMYLVLLMKENGHTSKF